MARILLVDDEPEVQETLGRMLEAGGHEVELPTLDQLQRALADGAYDLVVTDLQMPDMDGRAVASWVRAHRPGIPVMCVTGVALDGRFDPSMASFDVVLGKPLRGKVLLQAVEALCRAAAA
jgi:two-component system, chemotaxis family, chemotaxis protein CheY